MNWWLPMKFHFFKPTANGLSKPDKELISTLVGIRVAHNPTRAILALKDTDYPKMNALVIKLGEKILQANYTDGERYNEAKRKFLATINELFKQNIKFNSAFYTSQLLQYYTIICHEKFAPEQNTAAFLDFLAATKFEETESNLFITEYKLIKIYNDLSDLIDSKAGTIAPMGALEAQVPRLLEELNKIQENVTKWLEDAPDNVFVHYLSFSVNYCFARSIELQFTLLKDSLPEQEQSSLSDLQQIFFTQAQKALEQIKELKESGIHVKGSEFNLGQDVFNRLPAADLDAVQSHMHSLTNG
jgi:hypothetical protein